MKALITGASSGLGWDMAHVLSEKGYDIIAVARRAERLQQLKEELKTNVEIICADVTDVEACKRIAARASEIDVFINNAGFGVFGDMATTDLDAELKMLDTNIKAVHILLKLVANEFQKRGSGYILNVASLAAFFPGPLFGAYYASKSYVLRISQALAEELRQAKSKVKVSVLCPGPVHTEFGAVAKVNFGDGTEKGSTLIVLESRNVAEYAINKMFKGKQVIVPGLLMKIAIFLRRILPDKLIARVVYFIQNKKCRIK
ncbi:MAG: SDR family NAD(P)-dependent oxidoreductase [Clostridia bacterium]|nr:SDR family NAD(P)-dependent oxidoreductase [Clostridia bacterium]MBR2974007.1 SDR family NAD(P)-dependent oxidoreductase [Clostridia bacterium]